MYIREDTCLRAFVILKARGIVSLSSKNKLCFQLQQKKTLDDEIRIKDSVDLCGEVDMLKISLFRYIFIKHITSFFHILRAEGKNLIRKKLTKFCMTEER